MSGKSCDVCKKTAYPIEAVREGDRTWHKLCFRCSVCKGTLTLKNFKTKGGALFCSQVQQFVTFFLGGGGSIAHLFLLLSTIRPRVPPLLLMM